MKITAEYKVAKPIITVALAILLRLRYGFTRIECLTEARLWLTTLEGEE